MECIVKGFEPISLKPESNPVDGRVQLDWLTFGH